MDKDRDKVQQAFDALCATYAENSTIGIFKVKTANKTMSEAAAYPDPVPLFGKLWYEGELCCLFADSNSGKSILAIQMADRIARAGYRVLYLDFEMSSKQFQRRYTADDGTLYTFPDTLYRAEIDSECLDEHYDEKLLEYIEQAAEDKDADVLIIDNITWICAEAEKSSEAGKFMKALMVLKKKHQYSVLIVAHTPKRTMVQPITANDLAGSRKLFNFFDSVFAIGRSAKDGNIRYVKQVKCRQGPFTYDAENVIVCAIEKRDDGFTGMVTQGLAPEREHLREHSDKEREKLKAQVKEMVQQGKTYRTIATELGISKSLVGKLLKE